MNQYINFKKKLNSFINKYYKILLIRGLLFTLLLSGCAILIFSFIEYLGWFSTSIRFLFFGIICSTFIFLFITYLLYPILRFFNVAKRITYKQAALIIKESFTNIDDEIVNIIELSYKKEPDDLTIASINQKIGKFQNIDFNNGLDFKSVKYLFPYLFSLLLIFSTSLFFIPQIYSEGSKRIFNYSEVYIKNRTFNILLNDTLYANRNEDFLLEVKLEGYDFPKNLFLKFGNNNIVLQKINDSLFQYTFRNLNNQFSFYIFNEKFTSKDYYFNIIDQPTIENIQYILTYPPYINKKTDVLDNVFDVSVPYGTEIEFIIESEYTSECYMKFDSTILNLVKNESIFTNSTIIYQALTYDLIIKNHDINKTILSDKNIYVISDLYPSINVNYVIDESNLNMYHFQISIEDDYGFSKLQFIQNTEIIDLPINRNINNQKVYFSFDYSQLDDSVSNGFFKIFDNDVLNNFKSSNSQKVVFKRLSALELLSKQKEIKKEVEDKLAKSIQLAKNLQNDINQLQKEVLVSDLTNWEKQKKIESIIDKQNELDALMKELSNLNKNKNNLNNTQNKLQREILEKQKMIQENLESIMSEEFKDLLKQLEELQKEFDSKKLNNIVEDLDMNYEELNKELDKNLEHIRKFDLENQVQSTIEELNRLAIDQQEVAEKSKLETVSYDSVNKLNDTNKELFEKLMENYDSLLNENLNLDNPLDLEKFEEESEKISDSFNNTDSLSSDPNNEQDLSEELNKTKDKLEELAESMESMMNSNAQEQEGENADAMRLLLENLFYFSFTEEELLNELKYTSVNNPKYIDLQLKQIKLSDDYKIINDSLYALSKRVMQLSSEINRAAYSIEYELENINTEYLDRKRNNVLKSKQLVVQNTNDMILILSESLKNMQQSGGGGGSSSSKKKQKPKKGEPSLGDMRKSQQKMESDLKKMLDELKSGKGKNKGLNQQQMGKMLAKQEIFQQMLNELSNGNSAGSKVSKQLNEIKKLMEYNKKDLINMQLNDNTLFRQQQIVTRLLEAENAEQERDKDEKRKSEEASDYQISNTKKYFEQYNENSKLEEIIQFKKIHLESFYKQLFQEYIETINSD